MQIQQKPRRLNEELIQKVKSDLDKQEKLWLISNVMHCPWATLIYMVQKPDGRLRVCGDYRPIN